MSRLLRSLRPPRNALKKALDESPELLSNFESDGARKGHIAQLKLYLDDLKALRANFHELHKELLVTECGEKEQNEEIETVVESDSEFLIQVDRHIVKISFSIQQLLEASTERPPNSNSSATVREHEPTAPVVTRPSVNLPKLQLPYFEGNILHWGEFWDCFSVSIHENRALSAVDKMNYLKAQLSGDAKLALAGLSATAENYEIAVKLLKDRFGNNQQVIDTHYVALSDLPAANNNKEKLRSLVDSMELHLHSLEALGEDVNHRHFASLIKSKLPPSVVIRLEEQRGEEVWDVKTMREHLRRYLAVREAADTNNPSSKQNGFSTMKPAFTRHKDGPRNSPLPATAGALLSNAVSKRRCAFCSSHEHWSDECPVYPTVGSRKGRIRAHCFNFLNQSHSIRDCQRDKPCFYCKEKGRHQSSLCPKKFPSGSPTTRPETANVVTENESTTTTAATENALLVSGEAVMLQTAKTTVSSIDGKISVPTRLLFDCGSQRTYITTKLANELKLKPVAKEKLSIFTFASAPAKEINTTVVELNIKLIDGTFFKIPANVVPTITGHAERAPIDLSNFTRLINGLPFADTIPLKREKFTVDLLIGNNYYLDFMKIWKIKLSEGLYLQASKLGWILCGRHKSTDGMKGHSLLALFMQSSFSPYSEYSLMETDDSILKEFNLKSLWDLDTVGIKDKLSDSGDAAALKNFDETVRYEDGRYCVTWPWKDDEIDLPSNFNLSLGRLNSLIRRFSDKPEIFRNYQAILDGQIEKGIIERVDGTVVILDGQIEKGIIERVDGTVVILDGQIEKGIIERVDGTVVILDGQIEKGIIERVDGTVVTGPIQHYLPHHPVMTPEKTTTKIRIVYDGSAKLKKENKSLNECLRRGPVLLEDLCSLLIRFRLDKVGIVADVEKAFLQVGLQAPDRDATRFLWLRDPSKMTTDNNLQIFRFTRVPFGIISSPFLLAATIGFHLKNCGIVASKIMKNIYVDNIITGVDSDATALPFYRETKDLFNGASMNVREWASNSISFMNSIPEHDRYNGEKIKVLGLSWDLKLDSLSIIIPIPPTTITKRSILQFTAAIFDPLGLFSPSILLAKLLLQKLWIHNFDWDQELPEELNSEWSRAVSQLEPISGFSLPRFINSGNGEVFYELHCFCDASQLAYGTCIFLRALSSNSVSSNLIFSKARLAPIKSVSLPRLELLAVHICSRGLNFVEGTLPFRIDKKFIWSDSQCVLHWLFSQKELPTFVRNRVRQIRSFSNVTFRYVPSADNPADVVSRGASAIQLFSFSPWWNGPAWLSERDEVTWPANVVLPADVDSSLAAEDKSIQFSTTALVPEVANAKKIGDCEPPFGIDPLRYSTLTNLLRVTAYCRKFIALLRKKEGTPKGLLTAGELKSAKDTWIRFVQQKNYEDVFIVLSKNGRHPLVAELGLWVDNDGILRCGGRLTNSDLPELSIHPKLLPKDDYFTTLLIQDYHGKLFHAGVSHSLAQIRTEFWILAGRSAVYKVIRNCTKCKRFDGGPYQLPPVPPLPKSRVTPSAPFTSTGLDYSGPLCVKLKDGVSTRKVWICLFTCMSTRAIHLEVVEDMSSEQFLLCLQRFIARRGKPSLIISDNAPQFKLVKSAIEKIWHRVIRSDCVANYISSQSITWNFIVERAPWMDGFYERLVSLVKRSIRKSIGKLCLCLCQIQTLVTEIEAVINSRPLVYVGSDFNSGQVITPSHFLTLNPNTGMPSASRNTTSNHDSKFDIIDTWKKGQRHLASFWNLWKNEYLLSLRERGQCGVKQPRVRSSQHPNIGDVVLMRGDMARGSWKLAKIVELCKDADGLIRSAKILTPSGAILNRHLLHLFPLECGFEMGFNADQDDDHDEVEYLSLIDRCSYAYD